MGTEAEELKNDRKTRFKYTKEGRQIGTSFRLGVDTVCISLDMTL